MAQKKEEEKELTLNEKLAIIQTEFKSKKSRFNSFGKYNFRFKNRKRLWIIYKFF